jgi:hypothetical protein
MDAKVECDPHDLVCPVHDLGGMNHKGAPLLL